MGFDPANADALAALLNARSACRCRRVLTLDGFLQLRRELDAQPTGFLDSRIRRFQSFAEISTEPRSLPASVWKQRHLDFADP
ncbi:hypothetical protein ACNKHL_07725 [Shigella flexneri]